MGERDCVFMLGDFNLPNVLWARDNSPREADIVQQSGAKTEAILCLFSLFELKQFNTLPTREQNVLDLVLGTLDEVNIEYGEQAVKSDHKAVQGNFLVHTRQVKVKDKKADRIVYNFRKATSLILYNCLNVCHGTHCIQWTWTTGSRIYTT